MNKVIAEIEGFLNRLFPINRSITGQGSRKTLDILQEIVPLKKIEYNSGENVYDWIIPKEWNVKNAWIKDESGKKIVDFEKSNIHLVGYSIPIHEKMKFEKIEDHLFYREDLPKAIPYRTSYYDENWGFCVNKAQYEELKNSNGLLEVFIDSNFNSEGNLTVGELIIPGEQNEEILISTYICHPSLANDNLSGALMTAFLARELQKKSDLKKSYRIIWVPETIGAIAYSAFNESKLKKIQTGMVITTVAGPGKYGYKQSYNPSHSINVVIEEIFNKEGIDYLTYPFDIHGSDERQYSSIGFRINTASLTRDKYYEYSYYHTSLDDLDFISAKNIYESMVLHLKVLEKLNYEPIYKNINPNCEVMLSKHELYEKIGGGINPSKSGHDTLSIILWLLWLYDGTVGLYEASNRIGVDKDIILKISNELVDIGLLKLISGEACNIR